MKFTVFTRFRSAMNLALQPAIFGLVVLSAGLSRAAETLPRSTPEAAGVSSTGLREYIEAADKGVNTMHSFMLVRHGKVVAEAWWKPEAAEKAHVLWSLSKSFTSTAVGLAVEEGKIKLDDRVLKFFPEEAPAEPSENLKAMTVKDLLTMTCGHETEAKLRGDASGASWVKLFLAQPVPHKPGTHFQYNTPGTYMLSSIVTKVTGKTVLEYLKPRLFEPLGIADPQWDVSPQGNSLGGWGLSIRTEDIAKFGQLYLQKGQWNGKQLIPASWIAEASSKQVPNDEGKKDPAQSDWAQGYGFQFWRCRHDAFRGDGKDGQYCIVMPEQDAVVAITADTADMQKEINFVWDQLLPAMKSAPLPENPAELARLKEVISKLEVPAGGRK